jgi:WD40 repeat protein
MLTQLIVSAASVIYWWHPLTWLALKRLVEERERACDDLVLLSGHRASDYAAHLLAIATSVRMGLSRPSGMFISMASRPQIKQRIQAILEDRKRGPISLVASVPAVLMVSLVLAVLVALHPASVRSDAAWFDAAALVDQITLKKRYGIRDVVFSPDGTQLVTAGSGDSIRFWDPATGVQIDKWVARAGDETISVDVAVDNSKLVALSASGGIDVWDGRREGKLAAFQLPRHFQFVAIHPAGTMMAAIGNNEGVYLCRIGRTVGASLVDDGSLCATCCAFSPDGSYFAIGTDEGDIRVWSLNSPEEFRRIHRAHEGPVDSLVFTSDERQVLSCGPAASAVSTDSNSRGQRQIRIWDAEHGLAIGELQLGTLHAGPCRLAIAPDADLLAVDCTSTSTLWNLSQRRPWFTVEHGEPNDGRPVSVMDVSADGRFVARLGDDQKAQVWDMATSKPTVAPGNPHRHRVTSVELVADGHHVISTGLDGRLAMWNIETAQLARLYSAPLAKPTMVACARKRNVFVLCVDVAPDEADTASELLVYDVQQNTPRAEYRFRDSVRAITVDPLGTTVAVASSVTVESLHKGQMRTRIQMLDSRTGEVRGESRFHDADVVDLRFSRDGQTVGLISVDGSIRRWQVDSPETSLELSLGAPVAGGRLSSDLSCVFALMENRYGTGDATISRFNLDDGKTTPIVELRNRTVSACSVSEDMRHVAIGTHGAATDSRLRIHDGADGSLIRSIDLYGRQVTTVTFSADATQIIAGLDNGDIVVWDIAPGTTSD